MLPKFKKVKYDDLKCGDIFTMTTHKYGKQFLCLHILKDAFSQYIDANRLKIIVIVKNKIKTLWLSSNSRCWKCI